jgi:hypothetical protein
MQAHPRKTRPVRHAFVFLILLIFAVPWYWNLLGLDPVYPLILGLPRWFVFTIAHSFIVSIYTAVCVCSQTIESSDTGESKNGGRGSQ